MWQGSIFWFWGIISSDWVWLGYIQQQTEKGKGKSKSSGGKLTFGHTLYEEFQLSLET